MSAINPDKGVGLRDPLLRHLGQQLDLGNSPLQWIDLYAAQQVLDLSSTAAQATPMEPAELAFEMQGESETEVPSLSLELSAQERHCMAYLLVSLSFASTQGHTSLAVKAWRKWPTFGLSTCLPGISTTAELEQFLAACPLIAAPHAEPAPGKVNTDPTQAKQLDWLSEPIETEEPELSKAPKPEGAGHIQALVFDGSKLYLRRFWQQHQHLEQWRERMLAASVKMSPATFRQLQRQIALLFTSEELSEAASLSDDVSNYVNANNSTKNRTTSGQTEALDWQKIASAQALLQALTLISGGPGTGKTTTAAKIVFLLTQTMLLERQHSRLNERPLQVRFLAPTGKAAARLASAIRAQVSELGRLSGLDASTLSRMSQALPERGETLHRFLYQAGAGQFGRYQSRQTAGDTILLGRAHQPMAAIDLVVVDESSMIDLNLMAQFIEVLPENVRVVMLGDHYQLPPVEPGDIFGSWVRRYEMQRYNHEQAQEISALSSTELNALMAASGSTDSPLAKPLCRLQRTYRFDGPLKHLADTIKDGDFQRYALLFQGQDGSAGGPEPAIHWCDLNSQDSEHLKAEFDECLQRYADFFKLASRGANVEQLAASFEQFQILCASYDGKLGVDALNHSIERRFHRHQGLYHGKAILVTQNHHALNVFNGDIGFVVMHQGRAEVHFPLAEGGINVISPQRLHHWQTAYAMTVHKSQGSEYQRVSVFLDDYAGDLATRALLYTAVTRSKQACQLWVAEDTLRKVLD